MKVVASLWSNTEVSYPTRTPYGVLSGEGVKEYMVMWESCSFRWTWERRLKFIVSLTTLHLFSSQLISNDSDGKGSKQLILTVWKLSLTSLSPIQAICPVLIEFTVIHNGYVCNDVNLFIHLSNTMGIITVHFLMLILQIIYHV